MSISPTAFLMAVFAGCLLGAVYFAALWMSVRSLARSPTRMRSFAAGAIARLAVILGVLAVLLARGTDPALILVGGAGFLGARLAATGLARRPPIPETEER